MTDFKVCLQLETAGLAGSFALCSGFRSYIHIPVPLHMMESTGKVRTADKAQ